MNRFERLFLFYLKKIKNLKKKTNKTNKVFFYLKKRSLALKNLSVFRTKFENIIKEEHNMLSIYKENEHDI